MIGKDNNFVLKAEDEAPNRPRKSRKIEKAASNVEASGESKSAEEKSVDKQEEFPRNSFGLLSKLSYPKKDNGLIDWRKLIPNEYIALNRMAFAARGISVEELSSEEYTKFLEESPDEDLVIKLGGFRELALIRGYTKLKPELIHYSPEEVVMKYTIEWIPNLELSNVHSLEGCAFASASVSNTDQTFSRFLVTIAENRAFIRAVRSSLGIISLGQEEFKLDDIKTEVQNTKIQSLLSKTMDSVGVDLDSLKILTSGEGYVWNDKWTSVERIDPAAAMSFIPLIKKLSSE